jgi:hypothetical protein
MVRKYLEMLVLHVAGLKTKEIDRVKLRLFPVSGRTHVNLLRKWDVGHCVVWGTATGKNPCHIEHSKSERVNVVWTVKVDMVRNEWDAGDRRLLGA